jgi:hypothetical protein
MPVIPFIGGGRGLRAAEVTRVLAIGPRGKPGRKRGRVSGWDTSKSRLRKQVQRRVRLAHDAKMPRPLRHDRVVPTVVCFWDIYRFRIPR